ncbi:MAG: hypothetical protein AB7T74_06005 [Clostridia bacterium]
MTAMEADFAGNTFTRAVRSQGNDLVVKESRAILLVISLFSAGLRRYESGNQMDARI